MKRDLKFLLVLASASLTACALMPLPNDPVTHKVHVNGAAYWLTHITESTWTARTAGTMQPLNATPANTVALRRAIEQLSGCNVTDSDYSREGIQFDAQVACDSKLAN